MRQRPQTAKATVFFPLEGETGNVNVIGCPGVAEERRREVMGATLMGVHGPAADGKQRPAFGSQALGGFVVTTQGAGYAEP